MITISTNLAHRHQSRPGITPAEKTPLTAAGLPGGASDRQAMRRTLAERVDTQRRPDPLRQNITPAPAEERTTAPSPQSPNDILPSHPAQKPEQKSLWQSAKSWGAFAGKVVCDLTGVTSIYEGVREGDWKKIATGSCQLVGTALAFTTGAGLGMIVAGAALQNAGTIVQAVASGDPMAIGGAALAVASTVVLSKYGSVVSQKVMNTLAPVGREVLAEGLTKVGQGLGHRIGEGIIAEKGAAQLTSIGIEAGRRGAAAFSRELESFVGPAVDAAKKIFGPASEEVARVASERVSQLSVKALTPEIDLVMTKLGVTDRVASVVSKELIEKAANAGILGQMGFGGGRVLSFMGLGNTALRESIRHAAPELGEEGSRILAKHLCRAVQQGGYNEILQESLTTGISSGLRSSLKSVLEDPMRDAFKGGIAGSVKAFAQKHGIEHFEGRMMQGAAAGFDDAYTTVLRAHVHAGVAKALQRRGDAQQRGAATTDIEERSAPTLSQDHSPIEQPEGKRPLSATPDDNGIRVTTHTREVREGDTIVREQVERTYGSRGIETRVVGRSEQRAA